MTEETWFLLPKVGGKDEIDLLGWEQISKISTINKVMLAHIYQRANSG